LRFRVPEPDTPIPGLPRRVLVPVAGFQGFLLFLIQNLWITETRKRELYWDPDIQDRVMHVSTIKEINYLRDFPRQPTLFENSGAVTNYESIKTRENILDSRSRTVSTVTKTVDHAGHLSADNNRDLC